MPELANQSSRANGVRMVEGKVPFVVKDQAIGKNNRYVLHHVTPIQHGGGVYDLDNLIVVTPRYHAEVLDPDYHQ